MASKGAAHSFPGREVQGPAAPASPTPEDTAPSGHGPAGVECLPVTPQGTELGQLYLGCMSFEELPAWRRALWSLEGGLCLRKKEEEVPSSSRLCMV